MGKPGYKKIRFSGEQVKRGGLQYFLVVDLANKAFLLSAII
jgi:hypothetical protein